MSVCRLQNIQLTLQFFFTSCEKRLVLLDHTFGQLHNQDFSCRDSPHPDASGLECRELLLSLPRSVQF